MDIRFCVLSVPKGSCPFKYREQILELFVAVITEATIMIKNIAKQAFAIFSVRARMEHM